jgi:hypothetical protein
LIERGELLGALEQEVQLRRKGSRARIAIEALQKGILRGLLEHRLPRQALAQLARETRLADTDRTFDDDEAKG